MPTDHQTLRRAGLWRLALGFLLAASGGGLIGAGLLTQAPAPPTVPDTVLAAPARQVDHPPATTLSGGRPAAEQAAEQTAVRGQEAQDRSAERDPAGREARRRAVWGEHENGPLTPVSIAIPGIGLIESTGAMGRNPDGTMALPPDPFQPGWFTGSAVPGALGPAVIAGHVTWQGEQGPFARLGDVRPGMTITVERRDGTAPTFQVTKIRAYPKKKFPTDAVYGPVDHAALRLITCGGEYREDTSSYTDNLIVFAERVSLAG